MPHDDLVGLGRSVDREISIRKSQGQKYSDTLEIRHQPIILSINIYICIVSKGLSIECLPYIKF